ncbi:hypothetical protein DMI70_07260 [Escherichia coli]|nr:hypothetical protein [Escherichia coli]
MVSKATHGLKMCNGKRRLCWPQAEKLRAGQSVASDAPAYQAGKDNYYAISAIAYDNKGNASKRVQTEVVISGAGMSADRTALTLDGQSRIQMLANGNEQKPLVLSLRDAEGSQSRA